MNKVQKELLNIMKDIENVLSKSDIVYSLSSGTALGAARHKGFIPGDDDIDYDIPEYDFQRAMKLLKDKLPKKYNVVGPENNRKCSNFFGKVYNTEVEIKANEYDHKEFGKHLYIDIFHLTKTNRKKVNLMKGMIFFRGAKFFSHDVKVVNYLKNAFLGVIPSKFFAKSINKKVNKYRDEEGDRIFCTWVAGPPFEMGETNMKFETKEIIFEGLKTRIGKEDVSYLKAHFGDTYMELPPVKDRVTHGIKLKGDKNE